MREEMINLNRIKYATSEEEKVKLRSEGYVPAAPDLDKTGQGGQPDAADPDSDAANQGSQPDAADPDSDAANQGNQSNAADQDSDAAKSKPQRRKSGEKK